jgi:hypothetical protein
MYPITAANSADAHTRNNSQVTDSLRATSSADVFSFGVLLWWLATGGVVDQVLGLSAYQIRGAAITAGP